MKGVQDVNGIGKTCDVKYTEGTRRISHANLPNAGTDAFHGLPIRWIKAVLDLPQFEAGLAPHSLWKFSNSITRISEEDDWLHGAKLTISKRI